MRPFNRHLVFLQRRLEGAKTVDQRHHESQRLSGASAGIYRDILVAPEERQAGLLHRRGLGETESGQNRAALLAYPKRRKGTGIRQLVLHDERFRILASYLHPQSQLVLTCSKTFAAFLTLKPMFRRCCSDKIKRKLPSFHDDKAKTK